MEWLEAYLLAKPGALHDYKVEWKWDRYMVGGKLFAARCNPSETYKVYGGRRLLTLKCDPGRSELLRREFPGILPGFYTDKRTWISIRLDGGVERERILRLCDASYDLVFARLTRRARMEIMDGGT